MNEEHVGSESWEERGLTGGEPAGEAPGIETAREGERRGPETAPARGIDATEEARPGVPMEASAERAEAAERGPPTRQRLRRRHLKRKGLDRMTPVVGTGQPPRGASGALRKAAYEVPEHRARHWGLLLLADRVDVLEGRVGGLLGRPLRRTGWEGAADRVERNPFPFAAGLLLGGLLMARSFGGRG